jgi:predicted ribosomally synthesized peptide with nif11-like leader
MSAKAVQKFFEMLTADEAIVRELDAVTDDAARSAIVALAARYGCDFTVEELDVHMAELAEELSDEDLDRVAGGASGAAVSRFYRLIQRDDGSASIGFGDGAHGRRPPTGSGNVSAKYRTGGGSSGKTG